MYTIFLVSLLLRHNSKPLQHLLLTVCVMLMISPTYLMDVGAQLSVSAVTGIMLLYGPSQRLVIEKLNITEHAYRRKWYFWPVNALLLSLSAQVFTLPLVAFYFHRIPLYGILLSVVLIPLTTITIYLAIILLAVGSTCTLLASIVAWCVNSVVGLQMMIMQFTVSLPGAMIPDFWSRKASSEVVIYNNRRCPALHIIASPSQSWLLTPTPESADSGLKYIANSFWAKRLTSKPSVIHDSQSIAFHGLTAIMLNKPITVDDKKSSHDGKAIQTDLMWLCTDFRGSLSDVVTLFKPRLVILDASIPFRQRKELQNEAARLQIPVFDIAERGALRMSIAP